jgi:lipoyl(octanoyl) transferase
MADTLSPCRVVSLGRIGYLDAWALQKRLVVARSTDQIPDTLLWVEHPHTYTLGSSGHAENVLFSPEELAAYQIEVHNVDRGGDVTYHGPGQLVGYPILKLERSAERLYADVVSYIRQLEQTLIDSLALYNIAGWRYPGYTGVWTGDQESPAKIAAIGVKVTTRCVTFHGFALNVNTNLDYFKGIIPCGIRDKAVTSMQVILGEQLDLQQVADTIGGVFAKVFNKSMFSEDISVLADIA